MNLNDDIINSVEKFTDDKVRVSQDEEKGILRLEFEGIPSKEAELLLKSFELGVTSIYDQYGKKFLNIKFRRE